jgi:hypothetical protein
VEEVKRRLLEKGNWMVIGRVLGKLGTDEICYWRM